MYALAARCAERLTPDIYEFQQALYNRVTAKADIAIARAAETASVDSARLAECIASGWAAPAVAVDRKAADELGIRGTPTFVIGPTSRMITGRILRGAMPAEALTAIIDSLLAGRKTAAN